jgi:hypothetical protein
MTVGNGATMPHSEGIEDAASNTVEAIAQAQAISAGELTITSANEKLEWH